jgi:hypothetical protein
MPSASTTALAPPLPTSEPPGPAVTIHDRCVELRWIVRVDGRPAAIHTLRSRGEHGRTLVSGASLPPWSSARLLAPALHWSSDVRPRVLRPTDRTPGFELDDTAPAISIHERGLDPDGVQLEHDAIILADFVAYAQAMLEVTRRPARLRALASDAP